MHRKHFTSILRLILFGVLIPLICLADPKVDPIRFSISTDVSQVLLNEEFEIKITAKYLNIPSNAAFVFEGANSFKLKIIVPDGFVKTGGTFSDFVGNEL